MGSQDGYLVVNSVIKGGPAELSGQIHPRDKIQGIGQGQNGRIEDITSMPLADAMALIRGNKGTVVHLDVLPGGNGPSKIVELVRDEIKIEPTAEKRHTGPTYGAIFRGKQIWLEVKTNPDGTRNDTYRDNEGNPLSELESSYLKGYEKLNAFTYDSNLLTLIVGPDAPNSLLMRVVGEGASAGFGENPEFRAWSGITLEQIRSMRLAVWDMVDFPPDELVEIYARAVVTEDVGKLATLGEETISLFQELSQKKAEILMAELSPEQIQKLWELEWQIPDSAARINNEDVIVGFERYNALDLSEEQKKLLETLKKEFLQAASKLDKLSGEEKNQKLFELVKVTRTKLKDTLTAAQKAKLDRLLAEKPKFLTQPAPPPSEKKRDEWVPGPNSWQPGDPLPPGVLPPPPPAGRFPRG